MTTPLGHLVDITRYAATRRDHDRHDRATVTDLTVNRPWLPPGIDIQWLGVAGFAVSSQGTTLLIDPFVSRISLREMIGRHRAVPNETSIGRWVPRCDAVLIGHTHFDHAIDAPAIARRDGACVYGGTSAAQLMRLHGLGALSVQVDPHVVYEIGPFRVRFIPSCHAKLLLGTAVPQDGAITCDHLDRLTARSYRCGEVWGIHISVDLGAEAFTIYHQGSADLIEEAIPKDSVDVFLCGVAGRQFTDRYVPRILHALRPQQVVVMHHDDFFVPLDEPQGFAFGVHVDRFPEEVAAVSREIEVLALAHPAG